MFGRGRMNQNESDKNSEEQTVEFVDPIRVIVQHLFCPFLVVLLSVVWNYFPCSKYCFPLEVSFINATFTARYPQASAADTTSPTCRIQFIGRGLCLHMKNSPWDSLCDRHRLWSQKQAAQQKSSRNQFLCIDLLHCE